MPVDILICIVPKLNPDAPTIGPALLKSHLNAAGFSCDVIDLNIKLFNALDETDRSFYFEDDRIFRASHETHSSTRSIEEINPDFWKFYLKYEHVFLGWVDWFRSKNPRFIGLSLLSEYSLSVSVVLSQLIRKHLPDTKIVWGGPAMGVGRRAHVWKNEHGLMDHYVYGDAEISLVELLKGNTNAKGIDSPEPNQILDLNSMLIPNYDDIDWSEYVQLDESISNPVYVTGSRGCVKRCTFCDVRSIWPEYRFRSGDNIAREIIAIKERYGRSTFKFTDSLINGSMKSFRALLNALASYRQVEKDFNWTSQWIIRSKSQSPEEDFKLMKDSGCQRLEIGIESFSQDVRWHMGKKFTDEDMWWCFEMLQKYQIPHALLMIVGYPTETEKDHQNTIDTVRKLFELGYASSKDENDVDLLKFSFMNTLSLADFMPLYDQIKDELEYFEDHLNWKYKDNDLAVRTARLQEVNQLVKDLSNQDHGWLIKKSINMHVKHA